MSVRRQESSMKSELYGMFEADQPERQGYPSVGTAEYRQLRTLDAERRQRVAELMAAGEIASAEDYYHAAFLASARDPSLRSG
jgi:hypothetical protein